MWGTLLGLLDEDQCALGLMHQPYVQKTYIGSAEGAYITDRNGKRKIRSSDTRDIENAVKAYDAVPLIPIVESAGGLMTDWDGNSVRTGGRVVASANAVLHEKVLRLIGRSVD